MRMLRAVRLDGSDERVFPRAAEPEEWLVTGSFLFAGCDPEQLDGRARRAFRSGFLGIASWGFASLAAAADLAEAAEPELRRTLARGLAERAGAPDPEAALAAAAELLADARSLAEGLAAGALLAIERSLDPRTGALVERVRRIEAGPGRHARIFAIVPEAEEEADGPRRAG